MFNQLGSASGLCMILYAVFTFSDKVPFPGFWASIPVLGTALIIVYASPRTVVGMLLARPAFVGIGLVSYSAYLWHQPLFAFSRIRSLHEPSSATYSFLIVSSFCLAYLSWRLVEQPFRRKDAFSGMQIFAISAIGSVTILSFGMIGHLQAGMPSRFPPDVLRLAEWENDKSALNLRCMSNRNRTISPENACTFGAGSAKRYAIWGDSHAMELSESLSAPLSADEIALTVFASSSCPPTLEIRFLDSGDHCPIYNREIYSFLIDEENDIDTIFVIARWPIYIEGVRFDNREGGVETGKHVQALPDRSGLDFIDTSERIAHIGALYRATIDGLLGAGKKVVLVYPVPEAGWHVPRHLTKLLLFQGERVNHLSTSHAVFEERSRNAIEQLDKLGSHSTLIRIHPEQVFCSSYLEGRCVASMNGEPLYYDDDHLNALGSELLSGAIVKVLRENGWMNNRPFTNNDQITQQ